MEQCRVIAITNQKGGVGKTTTTVNLGVGLAKQGKRVLLIDADPQGSLTISLGERNPDQLSETLSDAMECAINDKSLPENFGLLRSTEGVDLMPANIELSGTEVGLFNVMSREYVLKSYIDSVSKNYDYILIDCMPSLGMMTINALAAADRVIIPSQPSFLSTKGLNQLMHSVAKVKRQINPRLNIDGILLTMVDNRTNNAKAISTALRAAVSDRVRVFDTQIPFSVRAAESAQDVINYARNPAKTRERSLVAQASLHAIDNVIEYAADTIKTEERAYVSCLNCREDDAAAQMMETKRYWGKPDGRLCFHGYQSFAEGEVTAETAHAIGVELAEELWGERFEVVIATHCNTGHYHNHFVINSVSWADGYKFNNSKSDYAEMRKISDRLCREHAISVIDVPSGKGKHYAQWSAEKNGKPTYRSMIRADIDRAIRASTTERDFIRIMQEMGYELKTRGKSGEPLKYPAIKPPDAKGYFRFHKLGEEYSLDAIKDRILDNISKQYPFPAVEHHAPRKYRVRGNVRRSVTGLQALYFRYCYELHILVKHPTSVKRVSFLLKEDVTKLDRLDAQTRLLARNHIRTGEDLSAYQSNAEAAVQVLVGKRHELRNELKCVKRRNGVDDAIKAQIKDLTAEIRAKRKEVVLCSEITERSEQVREKLERLNEQKKLERKERDEHELFGRRGRTGRENVAGRG